MQLRHGVRARARYASAVRSRAGRAPTSWTAATADRLGRRGRRRTCRRPGRPPPRRAPRDRRARAPGPVERRMSALDTTRARPADQGPVGARRRPPPLRPPRLTLAVIEFKLRFFGSVLGYLWQLMRPLLLFGVLYVVFTQVRHGSAADVQYYPRCCSTSIVLFTFFAEATSRRGDVGRRPREPRAQDPVPAAGDPARRSSSPRRSTSRSTWSSVLVFALAIGVAAALELARAFPLLLIALLAASPRARDAAVGAVRALPRHAADLGGGAAGALLRHADPLHAREVAGPPTCSRPSCC